MEVDAGSNSAMQARAQTLKAIHIGLKLYSTDAALIPEAMVLYERELFHYVELYVIPRTPKEMIAQWELMDVPFVIHAAHSLHGINLAQVEKEQDNRRYFSHTRRITDILQANWIIVHGGNNGSLQETIRQIGLIGDSRVIIENKPKIGLLGEKCIGWSPADLQEIADAGLLHGFVLDFAHASCAARSEGMNEVRIIESFLDFDPIVFHLSDGDIASEKDAHLNLGSGNRDLGFYVGCVPPGGYITLETPRNPSTGLDDFIKDVAYLSSLLRKPEKSKQLG
jgi:deoxyribonuclease-4